MHIGIDECQEKAATPLQPCVQAEGSQQFPAVWVSYLRCREKAKSLSPARLEDCHAWTSVSSSVQVLKEPQAAAALLQSDS